MTNVIEVFLADDSWYARYPPGNVARERIIELMRSDTLPTSFTNKMPAADVVRQMQALNPESTIVLC